MIKITHIGELPEYIYACFGAVLGVLNAFIRFHNETFVIFRVMNAFNAIVQRASSLQDWS